MNILLTNDDGINSVGVVKLAEALRQKKHRVILLAPDVDRSGISNALSIFSGPVKIVPKGVDTWSCSGYPADCVYIGPRLVSPLRIDLMISGINLGENLGTDIVYSGTASAARQASLLGYEAIALSLAADDGCHWDMAVSWAANNLEHLFAYCTKDTFLNVNIPNSPKGPEGIIATWPAPKKYKDSLQEMTTKNGRRYFMLETDGCEGDYEPGSDCDVVSRNYVSVSTVYNFPVVIREFCPGAPVFAAVSKRDYDRE